MQKQTLTGYCAARVLPRAAIAMTALPAAAQEP